MEYKMKDVEHKTKSGSAFVCSSDEISLHDCRASKIETDANGLTLVFPDGVWLLADNRLNTVGKIVRTGRAEVLLRHSEFEALTVFKPVRFFRRTLFSACREVSFETLRENVNGGKWTVEFIDDFNNADSHLFRVMLWSKKKQCDCLFVVSYERFEARFDEIQQNRVW